MESLPPPLLRSPAKSSPPNLTAEEFSGGSPTLPHASTRYVDAETTSEYKVALAQDKYYWRLFIPGIQRYSR